MTAPDLTPEEQRRLQAALDPEQAAHVAAEEQERVLQARGEAVLPAVKQIEATDD